MSSKNHINLEQFVKQFFMLLDSTIFELNFMSFFSSENIESKVKIGLIKTTLKKSPSLRSLPGKLN